MNFFKRYSMLVVLPHSVFALPFAVASFLLAYAAGPTANADRSMLLLLGCVVLAVVAARTAAMAFNRLIDRKIDGQNPRTAGREIPKGVVTKNEASALVLGSSALFFLCAGLLGFHCLILAPAVLFVLLFYSYTKRIGSYAHFVLGIALALAPGGAWWVLRPQVESTPLALMAAVLFWVCGFDVLYSCQDIHFDREHGVFSLPAKFGIETALFLAKLLHVCAFIFFLLAGLSSGMPGFYYAGVAVLGLFLVGQHFLLSPFDLSRVNHAFFTANGVVSLLYLVLISYCVRS